MLKGGESCRIMQNTQFAFLSKLDLHAQTTMNLEVGLKKKSNILLGKYNKMPFETESYNIKVQYVLLLMRVTVYCQGSTLWGRLSNKRNMVFH